MPHRQQTTHHKLEPFPPQNENASQQKHVLGSRGGSTFFPAPKSATPLNQFAQIHCPQKALHLPIWISSGTLPQGFYLSGKDSQKQAPAERFHWQQPFLSSEKTETARELCHHTNTTQSGNFGLVSADSAEVAGWWEWEREERRRTTTFNTRRCKDSLRRWYSWFIYKLVCLKTTFFKHDGTTTRGGATNCVYKLIDKRQRWENQNERAQNERNNGIDFSVGSDNPAQKKNLLTSLRKNAHGTYLT